MPATTRPFPERRLVGGLLYELEPSGWTVKSGVSEKRVLIRTCIVSNGSFGNVTRIADECFANLHTIESIFLPKSLEQIGVACLSGASVSSLVSAADCELRAIATHAFTRTVMRHFFIPRHLSILDHSFFPFQWITVHHENAHFWSDGIELFDKTRHVLLLNLADRDSYTFPENVFYVSHYCFYRHRRLILLDFGASSNLRELGEFAFSRTSIRSLCIPASVTVIKYACFLLCTQLHEVSFQPGATLREIEGYAFSETVIGCFTIPKSVEAIGVSCFRPCHYLTSITFESPSRILFIGDCSLDTGGPVTVIGLPTIL
jgi:hypothetical protein